MIVFRKTKILVFILITLFFLNLNKTASAWKNHALITELALKNSKIFENKQQVQAENIEEFLSSTSSLIPKVLSNVEVWTVARTKKYNFTFPETPDQIKFNSLENDPKIVENFLHAIRINPTLKLPLFLQILPGEKIQSENELLNMNDVIIKSIVNDIGEYKFKRIEKGQLVDPLQVLVTASDEPDYGIDIDLFDDNPKDYNTNYGFDNQPFGNANFSFSSQAPFHMGFYHESSLVYKLAPYIKKTFAEHRIKLFQELSKMAFRSGHPYWGLRFLGWSLHYVQDLTQPFHNAPIPGYSTADLIGLNILDKLEGTFYKTNNKMFDAINIITNRHFILEKLIYEVTGLARENNDYYSLVANFIQNSSHDNSYPKIDDNYIRDVISKEASAYTKPTYGSYVFWRVNKDASAVIGRSFPYEYTFDPRYIYNDSFNAILLLNQEPEKKRNKMYEVVNTLMTNVGSHTRNMVRYVFALSNY